MPRLEHPHADLNGGSVTLRGNLHTHTTRSDGVNDPQTVVDRYADLGYDFLMISDHDVHTSADDYAALNDRGLVLISGNEISMNGPHLLHVHSDRRVEPTSARQHVIDEIRSSSGFAVVNHPNWQEAFDHCPLHLMKQWSGYVGMEIYNGVASRQAGSPYATNKWDMLLAARRRVWGFANDDMHDPERDLGLGWNVVHAADRSAEAIVEALAAGRFYPSTGVTIRSIEVDGLRVRVETEGARRIVALRDYGERFAVAGGSVLEAVVPDRATYARFECWGDGESFAWTQPFFVVNDARAQRA